MKVHETAGLWGEVGDYLDNGSVPLVDGFRRKHVGILGKGGDIPGRKKKGKKTRSENCSVEKRCEEGGDGHQRQTVWSSEALRSVP